MGESNSDTATKTSNALSDLFSQSNVALAVIFLVTYAVIYYGIGHYYNRETNPAGAQVALSRSIDVFLCITFVVIVIFTYLSLSEYDKDHLVVYSLKWTRDYFDDPRTILYLIFFIILFYMLVYLCGVPMTNETRPMTIGLLESKLWILLAIQIILTFFQYVFGIKVVDLIIGDSLMNWWNNVSSKAKKALDISGQDTDICGNSVNKKNTTTSKNEVFNVSSNLFTYDDAAEVCSALGAKLATYDQVEETYNNGGEWCNYGWSADQMALFPTQKSTWNKLQETENHKNDCGRPGINGGVISNPYMMFGVNCYGKKPPGTVSEIATINEPAAVKTPDLADLIAQAKIKFWLDNSGSMLKINSYNKTDWSRY